MRNDKFYDSFSLEHFRKFNLSKDSDVARIRKLNQGLCEDFQKAQLSDLQWRKWHRLILSSFFCLLLIIQNGFIFFLIDKAFNNDALIHLQWFMGTLMSATLAESYFILHLIVKWVFKDMPYKPDHT